MTYNKFIFDLDHEVILRDFESAYRNCDTVYPDQFDISRPKFKLAIDKMNECGEDCQVLDVGAGYGVFVHDLMTRNIKAMGIEISPAAVKKGKDMFGPSLQLHEGDITKKLKFLDNSFNVITCFGVMNYILDYANICLSELKRLLKPDGFLFISMGFKNSNVFFRDIVDCEEDFIKLLRKYFKIEDFFVHYHTIGDSTEKHQNMDLLSQSKDLIAICR